MAKLTRQTLLQFGSTANAGSEIGVFGSYAAPVYTNNIATMQSGTAWPRGWIAETIATNRPFLEDQNSIDYIFGYMLCYLFQSGIAEYDAGTTYFIGSVCQVAGVPYVSLTDNNLGNTPSASATNWSVNFARTQGANVASAGTLTLGNDGNSFKVTGTTSITSITIKPAGSVVYLIFTGILTLTNGGNLILNGNFVTAANSRIELISDGTSWYEVARNPTSFTQVGLGSPSGRTAGTIYTETTDGFITGNTFTAAQGNGYQILNDAGPVPATEVTRAQVIWSSGGQSTRLPISFPIKKGSYYQVNGFDFNGGADNSQIQRLNFVSLGS